MSNEQVVQIIPGDGWRVVIFWYGYDEPFTEDTPPEVVECDFRQVVVWGLTARATVPEDNDIVPFIRDRDKDAMWRVDVVLDLEYPDLCAWALVSSEEYADFRKMPAGAEAAALEKWGKELLLTRAETLRRRAEREAKKREEAKRQLADHEAKEARFQKENQARLDEINEAARKRWEPEPPLLEEAE
jgi:hypothetical protein